MYGLHSKLSKYNITTPCNNKYMMMIILKTTTQIRNAYVTEQKGMNTED